MNKLEIAQGLFAGAFFISSMAGIIIHRGWMVVALFSVLVLLATSIYQLWKEV